MGERTVMQEALFYSFSLERHVLDDHLLRRVDRFVDLADIREHLRPCHSETGRPSIDPELMIRMLLVGYASPPPSLAGLKKDPRGRETLSHCMCGDPARCEHSLKEGKICAAAYRPQCACGDCYDLAASRAPHRR